MRYPNYTKLKQEIYNKWKGKYYNDKYSKCENKRLFDIFFANYYDSLIK